MAIADQDERVEVVRGVGALRNRLASRLPSGVAGRILTGASWLLVERVIRMAVAFVVTVWMVRYLGPADFGVLSYAISMTAIAEVIGGFGLGAIIVGELVRTPEDERRIVGSTAALQFVLGATSALATFGLIWFLEPEADALAVAGLLLLVMPLHATTAFDCSFQASMRPQLSVLARLSGFAVSTLVKVALLLSEAPLLAFAAAQAFEVLLTASIFVALYRRTGHSLRRLRVDPARIKRLLQLSWGLAIGAVALILYVRIDQVMLQHMVGPEAVGEYAAAARLSEVWYFVPVAAATALYPVLVATRDDRQAHNTHLRRAFAVAAWGAILVAVPTTFAAGFAVNLLYGDAYKETAEVLRIHIWTAPFIFIGTLAGRSLVARRLQRYEATRHIIGAPLNILLNLYLIPNYGVAGAAVATLITYSFVSYFYLFLSPLTRDLGTLATRAVALPLRAFTRR